ncbi:MAG: hypothetical protein AAGA67_12640 [Cyanobacteria bacterium P01_F01_bin.153]
MSTKKDAIEILGADAAISPDEVITPMTAEEAQAACDRINGHLALARAELLDLYRREGWRSLGYQSFRECAVAMFGTSCSYVYRILDAARIDDALGLPIGTTPESHARELTKVPLGKRKEVLEAAKELTDGKVTAAAIAFARDAAESVVSVASVVSLAANLDKRGLMLETFDNGDISIQFSPEFGVLPIRASRQEVVTVRTPVDLEIGGLVQVSDDVGVLIGQVADQEGAWLEVLVHGHERRFFAADVDPYVFSAGDPITWKDLSGVTHVKLQPYSRFRDELFQLVGVAPDDPRFVVVTNSEGKVLWHLRVWICETVTQQSIEPPQDDDIAEYERRQRAELSLFDGNFFVVPLPDQMRDWLSRLDPELQWDLKLKLVGEISEFLDEIFNELEGDRDDN